MDERGNDGVVLVVGAAPDAAEVVELGDLVHEAEAVAAKLDEGVPGLEGERGPHLKECVSVERMNKKTFAQTQNQKLEMKNSGVKNPSISLLST